MTAPAFNVADLLELEAMVEAWRSAQCQNLTIRDQDARWDMCVSENHIETCPCELALQDLIATHNKMRPR